MKKIIQKLIMVFTKNKQAPKTITLLDSNSNYVMARCGHLTIKKDVVMDLGNKIPYGKVPFIPVINYCDKCLKKMHITCAKCGRFILVGDEVGLYSPKIENLKISTTMKIYKDSLVTCTRCGSNGIFGRWIAPGKVLKKPNIKKIHEMKNF